VIPLFRPSDPYFFLASLRLGGHTFAMTRRRNTQLALTELVLATALGKPEDLMDPILRFIDAALEDEALVDQVHEVLRRRHAQSARRGRRGTPAEVVLRLQVLKHLKDWSYQQLEWEVRGNVAYRHFCRIHTGKVPDSTTMVRHGQLLDGKLHRPTEFGQMVQVQEAEGGIVTNVDVVPGKDDKGLLVPAVEHHINVFGRPPQIAATDRGFHSGKGERRIRELGVKRPVIPKPGHKSDKRVAHERQRWFRRGRAWRAGGEARISRLKHQFGMARSRYKGEQGTKRTVLWAAIANNLVAIGTKMAGERE
jgi:IS5 family transposase